jgi:hypothetical protein
MKIRDITDERLDEGPIWDKVKAGAKKIFGPSNKPAARLPRNELKPILAKIINGEQLDRIDLAQLKSIYKSI